MALAKKAVNKKSEWEILDSSEVEVPAREREMSESTREILEKVEALKPGQALRVPEKYTVTREIDGAEVKSVKCYLTLKRHIPQIRTRKDVNGTLWIFRLTQEEYERREAARAARKARKAHKAEE
jgi:Xaa-Pro aminopeptidase